MHTKKIKKMRRKAKGYIGLDYTKLVILMAKDYSQRKNIDTYETFATHSKVYIQKNIVSQCSYASLKVIT
jgi:hypothetical protein